ncbi:PD-(D/E)XK nuclease family protein [uncultured Algibacter sp.]|uniref:PD-(D/E)XK nuclease family protein n=1 Tax=uncultured Algibacter sp. TaxID=298659 RepID=UPI0026200EE5|nr:PD-(D/E)XK nuclease family protein [uncultured Algibacter sp.]
MTTFIHDVLRDLQHNKNNLSQLTFVLPSKRAGIFLKNVLLSIVDETIFSPIILSIEEFVEELSQLKPISSTELLFEFYSTYTHLTKEKNRDTFESFSKWAQILIQDFNEIDRYLIPQKNIFNYLSAIQDLKHWSVEGNKTDFIKKYLSFWNKLNTYYQHFTTQLLNKKIGYQGLIYREAVENLEAYIQNNSEKKHVFVGFNALNTAEESIIQELLQNDLAQIYWDIDDTFISNPKHDAALFIKSHLKNWKYFENNTFSWITKNYSKDKNISVVGIPKNIGQAKYIGSILKDLQQENPHLNSTAVVLGDENLLIPVLNSLPTSIQALNVTMGFPLKSIPMASLFDALFQLHKTNSESFYHKDIINILSHQFIRPLLVLNGTDNASKIIETIDSNNLVYLNKGKLTKIIEGENKILDLLFSSWNNSTSIALASCSKLILFIKSYLDEKSNLLALEYAFRFNELFNELTRLNSEYLHIKDISTLFSIYKELLSSETLDFQGEPLQGLQVMGMLESRVLDFETVIISSVNEGILPAGKSNNSFIPFDVKLENNLPTYKEKDAVYTYHFYRLLQRAKHVFILYNTEADVLTGGEKSRFLTQLELEGIHNINHQIVAPKVPVVKQSLKVVKKTDVLLKDIFSVAKKGFSPSSLTNYMRNPIDFYYQKILKIREYDDVEETVAANTLGTVVHNTLEDFYKPLINQILTVNSIKSLKPKIEKQVAFHFKNEYKQGDISKGKNLIVFEIAKRYVLNFLNAEIEDIKIGNEIKILQIEATNEVEINIPSLEFPVILTGKVDRVDSYNGVTRIIDYKTGNVQQNQVEVIDWEDITSDYKKYSKSFQVLTYAYMMHKSNQIHLPLEAGIISFKKLNSGFLKFAKKESSRGKKDSLITKDTILAFEVELKSLITEICNQNIDFIEKEV